VRLLLINGNTTQAVTDIVVAEARRLAPPDAVVTGVTARFGANIVTSEAEDAVAVLELLAEHHAGYETASLALYHAVFARHPAAAAIVAVRVVDIASTAANLDVEGRDDRILEEAETLRRDGAGAW
jgi:Asp/Glu/hydantoin racemase